MEFNHDPAVIHREPEQFAMDMAAYLSSACKMTAGRLERYGVRVVWSGHHSERREVTTKHETIEL
jgi:hypothetical protein